jgi:predicted regulator of Ras-like GTPase activity (Roadblock/LC7/MglB family)
VNGFDRATRYVGEHSAVHVAAVVDSEGLLVSNFVRGNDDPEMWAPYAVLLMEEHGRLLHHGQWGNPDRIDFTLPQYRIVICREHQFVFMVVADRHGDEMLTIRINQGLDIIRKYSADRYTQKMFMNPERSYVPSA